MAVRRPFTPPTSTLSGEGAPAPGMPQPPMPSRMGPQPGMPMVSPPNGQPDGGAPMQPPMPGGGPTSPLNISQMLQAKMGDRSAAPMPKPGASPLPPWGDEGTRAGAGSIPGRVPFSVPGMMEGHAEPLDGNDAEGAGDVGDDLSILAGGAQGKGANMGMGADGMSPSIMMRLLRSLGKI